MKQGPCLGFLFQGDVNRLSMLGGDEVHACHISMTWLSQVTVNNQMVIGSLMNICDDPERVSIGQDWIEQDTIRRTPIVVTGNDFSKVGLKIRKHERFFAGGHSSLGQEGNCYD